MLVTEKMRLGNIAEILAGITGFVEKGQYCYKVVQPNSFTDTGTMCSVEIQNRNDIITPKQLLVSGDILLKRLNPSFVYVVSSESAGMVPSQNLLVVRPGKSVDPFYLGYLLEQKEILGHVEHVTGSAAAGITVPIIPLSDQRKVGELWKLSRKRKQLLNEYIVENDRLVSMLTSRIITGGGNGR